jgi:transcriptional regulator with XRE-family HTH domain
MEHIHEINQKIAQNLIYYRKKAGFTQAELAEKINYSDKSVSKWESGNGVPDVYTLLQLAKLYKVSMNDLVGEETAAQEELPKKKSVGLHVLIMLLSCGIVWLAAILVFVGLQIVKPSGPWWIAFLYAVMISAIIVIVYASIWKYRLLNFFAVSTLVWMSLTCLYVTCYLISLSTGWDIGALWCVFLLGIPLQVLEVLWTFFRTLLRKQRGMSAMKKEEIEEK